MIKIGITGSVASGKSSAAKFLSKNKYPIFSADKIVKNLYKRKIFLKKIKSKFNLTNKRNIKKSIRNFILKDKKKLRKLEKIIHPLVRLEMKKIMRKKKRNKILIFEIPLLIESKLMKYFDVVLFIDAKKSLRIRRFIKRGGKREFFLILDSRQIQPRKKIKLSDFTIKNNKSLKQLKKNVNNILKKYE